MQIVNTVKNIEIWVGNSHCNFLVFKHFCSFFAETIQFNLPQLAHNMAWPGLLSFYAGTQGEEWPGLQPYKDEPIADPAWIAQYNEERRAKEERRQVLLSSLNGTTPLVDW